jgi:hypothetical protein
MRKSIVIVFSLIVIGLVILIAMKGPDKMTPKSVAKTEEVHRIKLIETTIIESHRYNIIEVDNHQYLSNDGGILHSESCQCKTKQN